MRLDSKKVLLAGVTGGIGKCVANAIADAGGTVFAIGRDRARMEGVLSDLRGGGHRCVECDLTDANCVPSTISSFGEPIDGAAYLAGLDETKPLSVLTISSIEKIFQVNVFSAAMLLKGLQLPGVMSKNGGSVVLVSSVMGIVGSPGRSVYSASKAAILGFAKSAALECAKRRIRVNTVLPGYVHTQMTDRQRALLTPQQFERIKMMHPLGLGTPQDIANITIFLLSDLSTWITGSSIVVDGGYSAA